MADNKHIAIDEELHQKLKVEAAKLGISIKELIEKMAQKYFKK